MPRLRTRLTPFVFLAVCIAGVTVTSRAQDQAPSSPSPASVAEPKFEVTSVKKSGANRQGGPLRFGMQPGGRFTVTGMPVSFLLTMAYGIQRFQLIGGPSWINSDRFDINAVAEDVPVQPTPPGTPNRMQLLLRSLLKERFALVVHNETRELPLSYLVMAREDRKLGERLRPSTVDCRALFAARAREGGPPPAPPAPPKPGEVPPCGMMSGTGRIAGGSMPMSNLASLLGIMLNRPVYDRTNLTGNFDIQLDYTPDQMPQIPPGATLPPGLTLPSPEGPALNTALEEQLGLKLDATRGPVDVLVIDSVAPPEPD
jgi:uncharacterized protein (TIGR03435 family)